MFGTYMNYILRKKRVRLLFKRISFPFVVLHVWVQVSKKLLNLKGLCVDYIPCVPLADTKQTLLENIYNFLCLHVCIQEFKASSIKTQSLHMLYVMF